MCVASVVGFLLLIVAFLACGAGFAAPFWIYHPPGTVEQTIGFEGTLDKVRNVIGLGRVEFEGLLGKCFAEKGGCKYFWEDDFAWEREIPDWHKAAQALYSFGYVILLSTVLLALLHLCCRCCCRKPFSLATVVGSLIVAGSVLVAAAIAVYMTFQVTEKKVNIEDLTGSGDKPHFYWGCFIAVGGVACALISSIFFVCEGCRHDSSRSYDGYETARTI